MKNYELTVVFHPDLEMNLDPALDKVKKVIESAGGQIIKEENEGKKRLSYAIKGQEFGIYYFFNVALPSDGPSKIEGVINITDEVIRHLLVKEDARKAKLESRRQAKQSDAGEKSTTDTVESTEPTEEKGE